MPNNNWALIMAGGFGERFWPKSRRSYPKQLLPITSQKTMIQLTIERLEGIVPANQILIITNELQAKALATQTPEIKSENIIAEPQGRDTAACIGLGAIFISKKNQEANMIVLPADHIIHDHDSFRSCLNKSLNEIQVQGTLCTIGIRATYPATGYGYIEVAKEKLTTEPNVTYNVSSFHEKPQEHVAKKYLESKNYFWNSGIFIWSARTILNEIKQQMPTLYIELNKIKQSLRDNSFEIVLRQIYPTLEKKSIDYGVMENAGNVKMVPSTFDWDDVGSWTSLDKHFDSDENGNICVGQAILKNCKNTLVYNISKNDLIATAIGLNNSILVQTDDAVLVCPKNDCQQIKELVADIRLRELDQFL